MHLYRKITRTTNDTNTDVTLTRKTLAIAISTFIPIYEFVMPLVVPIIDDIIENKRLCSTENQCLIDTNPTWNKYKYLLLAVAMGFNKFLRWLERDEIEERLVAHQQRLSKHDERLSNHDERHKQSDEHHKQSDEHHKQSDERHSRHEQRLSNHDDRHKQSDEHHKQSDERHSRHEQRHKQSDEHHKQSDERHNRHEQRLSNHDEHIKSMLDDRKFNEWIETAYTDLVKKELSIPVDEEIDGVNPYSEMH